MKAMIRLSFDAKLRDEVSVEAIRAALEPLPLSRFGWIGDTTEYQLGPWTRIQRQDDLLVGRLQVEVDDVEGFFEVVCRPALEAVAALAHEPFEVLYDNLDAGTEDFPEVTRTLFGDPTQFAELEARLAMNSLGDSLRHMVLPAASPLTIEAIAPLQCVTYDMRGRSSSDATAVSRVAVDLSGLRLDTVQRDRIARLSAALAREIAGDQLTVEAQPGGGAANWVLKSLALLDEQVVALTETGEDYQALLRAVREGMRDIQAHSLALKANASASSETETPDETQAADVPRG